MPGDVGFKFSWRAQQAKAEFSETLGQAITETFRDDITPEAKRRSPVDTGYNKGTIDYSVKKEKRGWIARLFTQSGYGAYLEEGTWKMRAQPYLWPAAKAHFGDITNFVKLAIGLSKAGTK